MKVPQRRTAERRTSRVERLVVVMNLEGSCKELEVSESGLVADDSVFAGKLGGGEGILSVHNLEHGGLTGGVAEASEAETLRGCGDALIERGELRVGGNCFAVELFELGNEAALGVGEEDVRGVAIDA